MNAMLSQDSLSEEHFRRIVEKNADAVLVVDIRGHLRFVNPAATALFRRTEEQLLGEPFGFPLIDGETTEIEILYYDHLPTIAEMRVVNTVWEGDSAFLATLRDITERRRLEETLQEALSESENARAKLKAIINSMAEGLIVADTQGQVVLINPAAERFFGIACQKVVDLPIDHLPLAQNVKMKILDSLTREEGSRFEFELPSPRSAATIQADTAIVRDRKDNKLGIVTLLKDITQQREIDRMKSEFISTTAHELRTPLTSILGYADILVNGTEFTPDERQEFLLIIRDRARALSEMVKELLDIARIESGQGLSLKLWPWPVRECVRQMEQMMKIQDSRYRFEMALEDDSTELFVDKEKIGQVLLNLLSNAVKYSPEGGLIRIEGKKTVEGYLLCISDEGIGMAADHVEKIFDKFFRVDASNTSIGGLGLGMSIVKNIVEAHRGTIRVESEPGRGTRVFLTLPAAA